MLALPDLPPISIPANYKFQETGVRHPYVVKYSKAFPSASPDSAYGPNTQDPIPAEFRQETPLNSPLHAASKYVTQTTPPTSFGPQQETSSFQTSQSNSQQPFHSFHTPTNSYQASVQEPGSVINSYGQPAALYGVLPAETDHTNSNLQTQSQNPSYNNAAQTFTTGTSASQNAYSVLQQNYIQPEVEEPSAEIGTYRFAQSGPYPQQGYQPSYSDLLPDTSRSDTNIPSDDVSSKEDDDFVPSTLAAATGSGYSRIAFQRSQQQPSHDAGLANQPEGELDLAATSISDVSQFNGDTEDAGASATSSEDTELRKENVFPPNSHNVRT